MKRKYDYNQKNLERICKDSHSYAECLEKLTNSKYGGNYFIIKKYITKYNIDVSHFTSQGWSRGKSFGPKRPISDYLSNKIKISSHELKKRLIKEGIFEHRCSDCNNTHWNNLLIPIELHHIDGNNRDNNLENLLILCPNCHAQTPNYCGKNDKPKIKKHYRRNFPIAQCLSCGCDTRNKFYCSYSCSQNGLRKNNRPTKENLESLLINNNWCQVAKLFNVSDNAIRKWAKSYGIPLDRKLIKCSL